MRVLFWTKQAQGDLAAVSAFISQDSPHYASVIIARLIAATDRLVILQNALETCSGFGERALDPERRDRELETIWEWGRMILSFNPDIQGFTRG